MSRTRADLGQALAAAVDAAVVCMDSVGGGDTSRAFRIVLSDGRVVFAKTHPRPPAGFFSTEAASLRWLAAARAVNVPAVLAHSDGGADEPAYLALEWITSGPRRPGVDDALGAELAGLHRAGSSCFGREDGRTTGSLALPNDPCATWPEFYAWRRLLPLARLARDRDVLGPPTIAALERVAGKLDRFEGASEGPARLHGDLWGGNRLVDDTGRNWLIDPAAHGGHREFDLAMMRLFGGFSPEAFVAYHDVHPLADGWADRVPLHQIAPLVVHAIKFGGGYVGAAGRAIEACA
jgi:fructosamine-3-kinase